MTVEAWRRSLPKWCPRGKGEKLGKKMIFLPTLHTNFSSFRLWNPSLFIGGGR